MEVPEPNQEVLNGVLKVLSDYKMKVVNEETLNTQDPSELKHLNSILRGKSKSIKSYLTRRVTPTDEDADLNACIQALEPLVNPWNSDMSILSKYWCEKIFETDNFATAEHIQRLNSKSEAADDSIMPVPLVPVKN